MTCESCRAKCEENDVEPPCDETGIPCQGNEIELFAENELAFEIYFLSRMEGVGQLAQDLEFATNPRLKSLTEEEACDLLEKLKVIHATVKELEEEDMKIQQSGAARAGRR